MMLIRKKNISTSCTTARIKKMKVLKAKVSYNEYKFALTFVFVITSYEESYYV